MSFAALAEVLYFEKCNKSEHDEVWYCSEEFRNMRLDTKRTVQRVHMLHQSSKDSATADSKSMTEDLARCADLTGIENLLSNNIIRKTMKARRLCWDAVLDEQTRQRGQNLRDPDRLAAAARSHMQWSGRRAHTIGLFHSRDRW